MMRILEERFSKRVGTSSSVPLAHRPWFQLRSLWRSVCFECEEQTCETKVSLFRMVIWNTLILSTPIRLLGFSIFSILGVIASANAEGQADNSAEGDRDFVTMLAPYEVKGARLEDFGFRFVGRLAASGSSSVTVTEVYPNTAAAKAGLRPGELIYKIDGKSMSFFSVMLKLHKMQERKWAELEAGKKSVTYSLEVRAPGAAASRTVTMILPSPAPHWGSEKWNPPEGRMPAVVEEAGALAALARAVMDNGIWSVPQDSSFLGDPALIEVPILGYEWRIVQPSGTHRIWVTQQRGKTEILLEHHSQETGSSLFLTSPSGAMEEARCRPPKNEGKRKETPPDEIRTQFGTEIEFWLTRVGRVTGRWPFEVLSDKTDVIDRSKQADSASGASEALAESFLKLPIATDKQKGLFFAALGKVGTDSDCWAYTETSRSLEDNHITTVRVDPSRPQEERTELLKVDGKVPNAAYLNKWRRDGHGAPAALGELPALSSVIGGNEVRVYSNETAAVVFEVPVKASNSDFSSEKFQARFRVNKTTQAFEDFSVKLREPMRVGGLAKVTDAGLEARFQTLDPALAPQPVLLRMGAGVRVLFVKFSRAFEATRTDFKRVVPFEDAKISGEKLP